MQISRLRVGNEDFLVASMIERCPRSMMLRELAKNAIEAAASAPDGRVDIGATLIDGVRKLRIWNSGPGMDATALHRMCDIAASIGKTQALDGNFGIGAKVASLPSNRHGLRYRSCTGGRVHQVLMGKRHDTYGRLIQTDADGHPCEVLDVTATEPLTETDWTEVVLLGNHPDQDTVADPFDGQPAMPPDWVQDGLAQRFHRLPPAVSVWLHPPCVEGDEPRRFLPLADRLPEALRHEAVLADGGLILHYFHLAGPAPFDGTALIHGGEFYDRRRGTDWLADAPAYGIAFGAKSLAVAIELPDAAPVIADLYRQFLRHADSHQHHVHARGFAALALRHRPAWLLDLLRHLTPQTQSTGRVQGDMANLFRTLGVRRRWWPPAAAAAAAPAAPADDHAIRLPPPAAEPEYEVAPEIVVLRDPSELAERGLQHRAARFYGETHLLVVNTAYAAFNELRDLLEHAFATHPDPQALREAALQTAETLLIGRICRRLVFALARRGDWHDAEVDQATTPAALTLACDDQDGLFTAGCTEMQRLLGPAREPGAREPGSRESSLPILSTAPARPLLYGAAGRA